MRMKPILFSTPMVKAILDGRKSQTRRVIKGIPHDYDYWGIEKNEHVFGKHEELYPILVKPRYQSAQPLPQRPTKAGWYEVQWEPGDKWEQVWLFEGGDCWGYSPDDDPESVVLDVDPTLTRWRTPGDILYVRETWYYEEHMHNLTAGEPDLPSGRYSHRYVYRVNSPDYPVDVGVNAHGWKPSIFMPREAARLFLRVVDVRVERLQEIGNQDALREGFRSCVANGGHMGTAAEMEPRKVFADYWDSLNAKRGYGWDVNPWVWIISFERAEIRG